MPERKTLPADEHGREQISKHKSGQFRELIERAIALYRAEQAKILSAHNYSGGITKHNPVLFDELIRQADNQRHLKIPESHSKHPPYEDVAKGDTMPLLSWFSINLSKPCRSSLITLL